VAYLVNVSETTAGTQPKCGNGGVSDAVTSELGDRQSSHPVKNPASILWQVFRAIARCCLPRFQGQPQHLKYQNRSRWLSICWFLPDSAMPEHTLDKQQVCLSVCLSVSHWYWLKTSDHRITQFSPTIVPGLWLLRSNFRP